MIRRWLRYRLMLRAYRAVYEKPHVVRRRDRLAYFVWRQL